MLTDPHDKTTKFTMLHDVNCIMGAMEIMLLSQMGGCQGGG